MFNCSRRISFTIPEEFRKATDNIFPGVRQADIEAFADVLGIGADYRRLRGMEKPGPEIDAYLHHFSNNFDLLIQKTWVEKADEERKEALQDRIPGLMDRIHTKRYREAIASFSQILEELAWLFFGSQSQKEDFAEYAFRIDAQMGLFWWYGAQLNTGNWAENAENDQLWAVLLIGLCYLTNL